MPFWKSLPELGLFVRFCPRYGCIKYRTRDRRLDKREEGWFFYVSNVGAEKILEGWVENAPDICTG